jgi:hypothetical protein
MDDLTCDLSALRWRKSSFSSQNGGCVVAAVDPGGNIVVSDDKETGEDLPHLHFTVGQWNEGHGLVFHLAENAGAVPDRLLKLRPAEVWYYATGPDGSGDTLYFFWEELQNYWSGLGRNEFSPEALQQLQA